jgi:hypothetical protein
VCDDGAGGVHVSINYEHKLVTPIGVIANLSPDWSIPLFAKASARVEQPLSGDVDVCSTPTPTP